MLKTQKHNVLAHTRIIQKIHNTLIHVNYYSFPEALLAGLSIASSFLTAENDYVDLIKGADAKHRSILYIEVQNYANVNMVAGVGLPNKGLVKSELPQAVKAGTRGAFTITQNEPFSGVELAFYWVIGDYYAAIVAKSYQQAAWRPSTELGVCMINKSSMENPDQYDSWNENACSKPWEVENIVRDMQCCLGEYCIQATTTTSHQPNITAKFWPKSVSNLKHPSGVTQEDLDEILLPSATCYVSQPSNSADSYQVQSIGKCFLLIIAAFISVINMRSYYNKLFSS